MSTTTREQPSPTRRDGPSGDGADLAPDAERRPAAPDQPAMMRSEAAVTTTAVMYADLIDDGARTMRDHRAGDLVRVEEAGLIATHADHLLVLVVDEAREAGRSWAETAAVLGISAGAARQGSHEVR